MGIGLAIGALASGIGAGTVISGGIITLGFSFTAAATSFALGALQSLLTPKPKKSANLSSNLSIKSDGITQNIRQAITSRRTIYGECRVGGALTFVETTSNEKYLHMIITVADHECQELGEIWFDNISIPADYIDGSGNVTAGSYSGKARIKKHLGGAGQVADSDLVSETSVTSNFVGNGITYLYVRLEYDRDVYPSSIPTITVFTKGKKIYDVRDTTTRYTANCALFCYDYLVSQLDSLTPGVGVEATDIDSTELTASTNVGDEIVSTSSLDDSIESADASTDLLSLTGVNDRLQFQTGDRVTLIGGSLPTGLAAATNYYVVAYQRIANDDNKVRVGLATSLANALAGTLINITGDGTGTIRKNGEPRYYGGGVVETSDEPKQNIEALLSGCGGSIVYLGGKWLIKSSYYATPTHYFSESHITSKINVRPKVSRKDRFNLVKGVYVSPLNDGEASDYPAITNSTYVANDNGRTLPIDYDLPMTQRPHTAQRLAKIKLEKHRQEIFVSAEFSLHAMKVQPGDNIYLSLSSMGWTNKVFEVLTWALKTKKQKNTHLFYIEMELQETASAVYDWNNGEETAVDPAPNTNLPNPLNVNPPVGLNVTPVEVRTAGGDLTYEFIIGWTPPVDIFVINGGHYDVEFKKSANSEWRRSFRAEDTDTTITVKQVEPGVAYDVRMRAVNNLGVRSSFQYLYGFTVTSPSGATIAIDYLQITGSVIESYDYGAITGSNDATTDYGSLT